jgi:TetR/AcrR family transcriptional regulator
MSTSLPLRKRGRPSDRLPAARVQVLDATVRILDRAPQSLPSLRAVAAEAGVSPALLHYHFTDLPGLMRSLYEEHALQLLQPLLKDLGTPEQNAGAGLSRFLQKWTALALRHPWLGATLLRTPVRATDSTRGFGASVEAAVARAQREGSVRSDLPAGYIALLLLSMGTMPHLAQTLVAAGIDPSPATHPEHAGTLTLLHISVLQAGVARIHSPRQDSGS